jgi:hypothetical protein
MAKPLCFVLLPFGKKPANSGTRVDFDAVYRDLIVPAIAKADLEALRADEEMTGGIFQKSMFERLILCEYAVADVTTANAIVFYELGIRHAMRSQSTVLIFAEDVSRMPFDFAPLKAMPYRLNKAGKPDDLVKTIAALTQRLVAAKAAPTEKPVFNLVEGFAEIDHTKTDVFRERVQYSHAIKKRLANARQEGVTALRRIENELEPIEDVESGIVIDLLLSYRAVQAWPEMVNLTGKMAPPLAATAMVQEQLALALNRGGKGEEAEQILMALIRKRGPSSETYGILGRVYKDRWERMQQRGEGSLAQGWLDRAIAAYLKGFEADWRDAYPGINAVTLMELRNPPDPRREQLIPVVAFAVERRIAAGAPDYWDFATQLELAVLAKDESRARAALANSLASIRESWEPETTARNLRLIREMRAQRNEMISWADEIEKILAPADRKK